MTRVEADLRTVAAGRRVRSASEALPVQVEAARDVLSRCDGFGELTRLDLQQARADMRARLDRADDAVGRAEALLRHRRIQSDDLRRSILASQDPVAIDDVSAVLVERRRKTRPVGPDDENRSDLAVDGTVAMLPAYCDLGGDCARDGFAMTTSCALQAACGVDQRSQVLAQLAPAVRPAVDDLAATFVRAIRDTAWTVWGL